MRASNLSRDAARTNAQNIRDARASVQEHAADLVARGDIRGATQAQLASLGLSRAAIRAAERAGQRTVPGGR